MAHINKAAYSSATSGSTASSSIRTFRPKPLKHMRTGITGNKTRLLMFHQIIDVLWSIAVTTLGWLSKVSNSLCRIISSISSSFFASSSTARDRAIGQRLTFDNGRQVEIKRRIAEGGFSVIYLAKDCCSSSQPSSTVVTTCTMGGEREFALKRMLIPDNETLIKIRQEKKMFHHPNLMPLLGFLLESESTTCGDYRGKVSYMLFPLIQSSLREEITRRNLLSVDQSVIKHPFTSREIIQLFTGVVDAVQEMHSRGYAHRDVKLENVLLDNFSSLPSSLNKGFSSTGHTGSSTYLRPVLMDFGSAFGPLHVPIKTRSQLMTLVDDAATNCTVSYRAPELFEGGAMYGEEDIDLSKADVWSLGCLLFALMFGASPFECELRGEETTRIVDCSYLRILGNVPKPLPETKMSKWYSPELMDLTTWILNKDRFRRPKLDEVKSRVEELLLKFQGKRCWLDKDESQYHWDRNGNFSTTIVEKLDINQSVSVDEDDMEALLRRV